MKINYDFYSGKDKYCDGEVEKDVIKYLEEYGEERFKEIFEKDVRWPVFYHISPIRKNILNWYPFKENSEVLEIGAGMGAITGILCDKAGSVTSVELSKQRAKAIQTRCKNKENLEIIIGNFNDIKFTKKFDYITLIGVLEYAPLYTGTENAFNDFLEKIKVLLKPEGKLLIAIENQFGMKYFAGAKEDHTAIKYDGIIGYKNKKGIRTFGKEELKQILYKSGFEYTKFYYPLPDYKLPNKIFSEEYLPDEQTIEEYTPYYSESTILNYDEKKAYKDIIKNKMFEFFANSFFIEASQLEIDTKIKMEDINLNSITKEEENFYNKMQCKEEVENDKEIEELKKQLKEKENIIKAVEESKSWKITKPLRNFRERHNKS